MIGARLAVISSTVVAGLGALGIVLSQAHAQDRLSEAQALYRQGQYFKSARYAFSAIEEDSDRKPEAYAWVTIGLSSAGLHQSASYFFIKTLQTGNKAAIRRVLPHTQELLVRVGGDLLRKYLIRHTSFDDYDGVNRSAYLYSLGKDALLDGDEKRAIQYFNGVSSASALWPFTLQLRGAAHAISGQSQAAIQDFRACANRADDYLSAGSSRRESGRVEQMKREAEDLRARCIAGQARTLYQMGQFQEADRVYDLIPKASFVWPDILFEQAWNSFGKQEYNRSLGKLVSYKSPALGFVFNTEVDVLRAQSFLALCLYSEANDVVNEFNSKYAKVGEEVKRFVENNANNLPAFYERGKDALRTKLHTQSDFFRLMNRFVRGPYFQNLVLAESMVRSERYAVNRFASMQAGVRNEPGEGFPGFLDLVLGWREKSIRLLGGAFVKNSLMDYHATLLSDFDKMAFIKLEMLSRAKDKLIYKRPVGGGDRSRGNIEPTRRDDQYYWSFNGEFWNDELGDYVFGLESECGK